MEIHQEKHCLNVQRSDLSGSAFDDVNLSGSAYEDVDMSGGDYNNVNMSACRSEKRLDLTEARY